VREFCSDHLSEADDAFEVAAKILKDFCVEDGAFNQFMPGVQLAMAFLDATGSAPQGPELIQAFKDLKHLLETNPTLPAIRGWAVSHYQ